MALLSVSLLVISISSDHIISSYASRASMSAANAAFVSTQRAIGETPYSACRLLRPHTSRESKVLMSDSNTGAMKRLTHPLGILRSGYDWNYRAQYSKVELYSMAAVTSKRGPVKLCCECSVLDIHSITLA